MCQIGRRSRAPLPRCPDLPRQDRPRGERCRRTLAAAGFGAPSAVVRLAVFWELGRPASAGASRVQPGTSATRRGSAELAFGRLMLELEEVVAADLDAVAARLREQVRRHLVVRRDPAALRI